MPFDVFQLDGLDLSGNAFAQTNTTGTPSSYSSTITVTGLLGEPSDPSVITVINSDYKAGYINEEGYGYILPTFGKISIGGTEYYIHGFTENGIFLTYRENVSGGPQSPGGYNSYQAQSFVLSTYGFNNPEGLSFPITFDKDYTVYDVPPVCFAEGTHIETVSGPVAIEQLNEGDLVVTASGTPRAIKWIGERLARPETRQRPSEFNPICVRPHAFGPDLPRHAVRLSPGHAVLVDGVLVPVGRLVNDATIVQEDVAQIRYFHIELETHDIVFAEGLPCESYLDDGNRKNFHKGSDVTVLDGRLDPLNWDDACAPLVADGPQLVQIQQRLHRAAEALGWVKSEEPDLRIEIDAETIAPLHRLGNRFWFLVPAADTVRLRSTSGVLAHVMPGLADTRRLGVAVAELRIDGLPVDLGTETFGQGFHPLEQHGAHGWRWTDGDAAIALAADASVLIELRLEMVAPSWRRAAPALSAVA